MGVAGRAVPHNYLHRLKFGGPCSSCGVLLGKVDMHESRRASIIIRCEYALTLGTSVYGVQVHPGRQY